MQLYYIYFQLLFWGYCNSNAPTPKITKDSNGTKHFYLRFSTITNIKLNWYYDLFYINGVKTVPINIADYLTPRAFAYWIMDDGSLGGKGLLLHTNSFTKSKFINRRVRKKFEYKK